MERWEIIRVGDFIVPGPNRTEPFVESLERVPRCVQETRYMDGQSWYKIRILHDWHTWVPHEHVSLWMSCYAD